MGTFLLRLGTGVAAIAAGSCALTGAARADAPSPAAGTGGAGHATVGSAQEGAVCRSGVVRPVAGLTARARVCLQYRNGSWVGSGELVLTATKAVSGAMSWGPRYYPARVGLFVGFHDFALRPGQTVRYALPGEAAAEPADTGADWEVWFGVPNGIRAVGFEGRVTSPVAARTPTTDRASRFPGVTRWTCSPQRVSGQTLSGVATVCVRQVKGQLQSRVSLTYTSRDTVDLYVGLSVDGVDATENTLAVPANPRARRTVTLPTSTAGARQQDRTVATFLRLGSATVRSTAVPVR
jgi:hypothetical protein